MVRRIIISTLKQARRVIIVVVGFTVLLIGIALLVLPGPAFLIIPLGLAILATEFVWARHLLRRVKEKAAEIVSQARGTTPPRKENSSPPD